MRAIYIGATQQLFKLNYVEIEELFRYTYDKLRGSKGQNIDNPDTQCPFH